MTEEISLEKYHFNLLMFKKIKILARWCKKNQNPPFQDVYYYLGPNPRRDNKFHIRPKRTFHQAEEMQTYKRGFRFFHPHLLAFLWHATGTDNKTGGPHPLVWTHPYSHTQFSLYKHITKFLQSYRIVASKLLRQSSTENVLHQFWF